MSDSMTAVVTVAVLVGLLAITYFVLGDYIYRQLTAVRDLRAERVIYKLLGVDSSAEQTWPTYLRSVLAVSFA